MTERLTPKWTPTLTEAFGKNGTKGSRGEMIAEKILREQGFEVITCPSDKKLQTSGIDMFVIHDNKRYGVDVKNNLKTNDEVVIEWDKLKTSKADFWMHVNDKDPDDFVIYVVDMMKWYINNHNVRWCGDLCFVPREACGE